MAVDLRPEEIASILRKQLSEFDQKVDVSEVGTVLSVGDGIAHVHGLAGVMAGELVEFKDGLTGLALNLEEDNVGIAVFGEDREIKEGDSARRTGRIAAVPVGEGLAGRVVDALGRAIDGGPAIKATQFSKIEVKAPGIIDRADVREPLQTGIKVIESPVLTDASAAAGEWVPDFDHLQKSRKT